MIAIALDFYEAQAHMARNTPGLTLDDGTFIDRWVERAREADRQRVTEWVRDKRAQDRTRAQDAMERLNVLQDDLVSIRKRAERNEVGWQELAKAQRRANNARLTLEKVYESLSASAASAEAMEADPLGYLDSWYARFPSLIDRRPNLAYDLAADQHKRGLRRLMP